MKFNFCVIPTRSALYSACREIICVTAVDPQNVSSLTPRYFRCAQCFPNARGGRRGGGQGGHFDGEKYSTPRIRAIKCSGNGRVRPWNGVRDETEREECSLTLELPCPGKEAFFFYWLRTEITQGRTTNALRRYETLPFFHCVE